MEQRPPQHLSVVAIEKGAFGSPSTKVAKFTYLILILCPPEGDLAGVGGHSTSKLSLILRLHPPGMLGGPGKYVQVGVYT